jgi:hypothetical protein
LTTRSKVILALHRIILRGAGRRAQKLWAWSYRLLAWAWASYLISGDRDAAGYVRGSLSGDDVLPGLSDIDVAVVLSDDPAGSGAAAVTAIGRWTRLRSKLRLADLLLDYPMVFERHELAAVVNSSTFTFGLDGPAERGSAYYGERVSQDKIRVLERPGLYGTTTDWRLLRGRDRRPPEHPRDAQLRRIAAWLELCSWWQWVFPACVDPAGPRTASLCVKLVAEPLRIWLWLSDGERLGRRADVLRRGLDRLPEEEAVLRRALELQQALPDSPDPPLDLVLPVLARMSSRIADLIATQVVDAGTTPVRVAGTDCAELILPRGRWHGTTALVGGEKPRLLPLCDWRSLACPLLPDECFAVLGDDPSDPAVLGVAMSSQGDGPYPALPFDALLVLPAARWRSGLRAIKCATTDPISFALMQGRAEAQFPNVPGWSVRDTAARALAEHRAWLDAAQPNGGEDDAGEALAMLLGAARVGLFAESLAGEGVPELPLTLTETVSRLVERSPAARTVAEDGLGAYRQFAVSRTPPPAGTLAALRGLVRKLPAYAHGGAGVQSETTTL